MCREKIPNIHEKKNDESIDSISVSLETLYEEYQRKRRRYLLKKRKTINEDKNIKILDNKVKESNKIIRNIEKSLDKLWNEKTKNLWSGDSDLNEIKKELLKHRKKYNRFNKLLTEQLKDKIGPMPEFEEGFGYILQFMN